MSHGFEGEELTPELAEYLGLEQDELDSIQFEWRENRGNSGDFLYNYYAYVPEHTDPDILEKTGWKVGQIVEIPPDLLES